MSSEQLDLRDGGNAQVIRVQPPADGIDQDFATTYRTIAQGNKYNAEGDAATTLANAEANNINISSWLGVITVVIVIGGFGLLIARIGGGG